MITAAAQRALREKDGTTLVNIRYVDSSNVEWVGWPVSGEPLMIVQFQGGTRYGYVGVSRQRTVAAALQASVGKYINKRIKPHFKVVRFV